MKRFRARDDGAAAVEFALVLPVLVVLVFAILQFGFAFAQVLALNSAARQGARLGVTRGSTCAEVRTATTSAADSIGGVTGLAVVMTTSGTLCGTKPCVNKRGDAFVVTASKPFGISLPFPFINPSVILTGKGEYRCESND